MSAVAAASATSLRHLPEPIGRLNGFPLRLGQSGRPRLNSSPRGRLGRGRRPTASLGQSLPDRLAIGAQAPPDLPSAQAADSMLPAEQTSRISLAQLLGPPVERRRDLPIVDYRALASAVGASSGPSPHPPDRSMLSKASMNSTALVAPRAGSRRLRRLLIVGRTSAKGSPERARCRCGFLPSGGALAVERGADEVERPPGNPPRP